MLSSLATASVAEAEAGLGWQVYATNQPASELSLGQAVAAYRSEYLIEADFGRLKGQPLSLRAVYLQKDAQVTGLIRLLSIGLRGLLLLEHEVRSRLVERNEELAGLYAGQVRRRTSRPRSESLLRAFRNLHLSIVAVGTLISYHVTPLNQVQMRILELLGWPPALYEQLAADLPLLSTKISEP